MVNPVSVISIHAPRTGSDIGWVVRSTIDSDFNPRSPHGERRRIQAIFRAQFGISIHAPRTGSDICARRKTRKSSNFNPRSPHGERRTPCTTTFSPRTISIHAPRTGSDWTDSTCWATPSDFNPRSPHGERQSAGRTTRCRRCYFNPRSPHGERRIVMPQGRTRGGFQSTLPARGATTPQLGGITMTTISIHAPRTGSDSDVAKGRKRPKDFNPRSPHGERHCTAPGLPARGTFQSTLPARGATSAMGNRNGQSADISIHAPRTGSDGRRRRSIRLGGYFNPRSPHGERHKNDHVVAFGLSFQSTLPARGATCIWMPARNSA